ncbi:MAG: response regulator [Chthoniobacteraceae bacterium]
MSAPLILLVSSDPIAEAAVRSAAAASGREVRQLGSDYGAMAVIHAALREAALALVDLDPALHGYELCRAAAHHMPVIALTAKTDRGDEEKAREHGACGCLCKPLEVEQVRAFLDQMLGVQAPLEL